MTTLIIIILSICLVASLLEIRRLKKNAEWRWFAENARLVDEKYKLIEKVETLEKELEQNQKIIDKQFSLIQQLNKTGTELLELFPLKKDESNQNIQKPSQLRPS